MASPPGASRARRLFYALSLVLVVMVIGTIGFHSIEGMDWIDSIYFESMIATGQGPPITLTTDAGKVFASIMAFVSVASVITGLFVTLFPIVAQVWRETVDRAEREARALENDLTRKKKDD